MDGLASEFALGSTEEGGKIRGRITETGDWREHLSLSACGLKANRRWHYFSRGVTRHPCPLPMSRNRTAPTSEAGRARTATKTAPPAIGRDDSVVRRKALRAKPHSRRRRRYDNGEWRWSVEVCMSTCQLLRFPVASDGGGDGGYHSSMYTRMCARASGKDRGRRGVHHLMMVVP